MLEFVGTSVVDGDVLFCDSGARVNGKGCNDVRVIEFSHLLVEVEHACPSQDLLANVVGRVA